ncbi:UBN2_3 domain-containing protein [Cephalotus follicularis]|uniref:UBN2_3 domain-containing protein n=1 Tax=Cephalotus follicularis TaxID=3775 RepID=A0A1Q3BRJ4_CEPFO|nr:UBN2_3 domain-containing protein [Cephalotus follicularis]
MTSSTTIATTSIPTPTTLTTTLNLLSNITNFVSIKLDRHNYLLWRSQFLSILRATQLYGYIDGSITCPQSQISMSNDPTKLVSNPTYETWILTDQLLLSWINATLSELVMSQVVGLTTLAAVWSALDRLFSSQSRARIMQLRYQLQTVKKGNLTVADYFNRVKSIADSLATTSQPVADSDLVLYILGGLGQGYESFVTAVMTSSDPLSSENLYNLLLNYELHQDQFRPTVESSSIALLTTTTNPTHSTTGQPSNGSAPRYNNTRYHTTIMAEAVVEVITTNKANAMTIG